MSKAEPLQKHTLNFVEGDFDKLRRFYPDVEVSTLVREIIHNFVLNAENAERDKSDKVDIIKVDGVELKIPVLMP